MVPMNAMEGAASSEVNPTIVITCMMHSMVHGVG